MTCVTVDLTDPANGAADRSRDVDPGPFTHGHGAPVATPESWRAVNGERTWSERFLAFVQRLDARSNSFPSMHTSVAMLTALYLSPHVGPAAFAFPVAIGLSCLFTKQHYLVDLPAGAALGWLAHHVFAIA